MQLETPASNSYGVSLPGSPFIIIGFNDSIAWGVTNAQRDVKDYYEIKFKEIIQNRNIGLMANGKKHITKGRIKVKGGDSL